MMLSLDWLHSTTAIALTLLVMARWERLARRQALLEIGYHVAGFSIAVFLTFASVPRGGGPAGIWCWITDANMELRLFQCVVLCAIVFGRDV